MPRTATPPHPPLQGHLAPLKAMNPRPRQVALSSYRQSPNTEVLSLYAQHPDTLASTAPIQPPLTGPGVLPRCTEHPILETSSGFNWCPRDPLISEDSKGPGTARTNGRQHQSCLGPSAPHSGLLSPCQQERVQKRREGPRT